MKKPAPLKVRFSASGYGTKTMTFDGIDDLEHDVYSTAGDYDAEVWHIGFEYMVVNKNGEEIARWETI